MKNYHMEHKNTIKSIFTEEEIAFIANCPIKDRRHPLQRLLSTNSEDDQMVLTNTARAMNWVHKRYPDWLNKMKPRLLNFEEFSDPSSALGEIRAFGAMLEAGIDVRPIPTGASATADFVVFSDGMPTYIEVHSKQYDNNESEKLERFNRGENLPEFEINETKIEKTRGTGAITSRMTVVTPFGKPATDETTTENVISRLAGIKWDKGREPQFPVGEPSILWLDFQDELWNMGLGSSNLQPVRTWNGGFQSGEIWYSLYGWKEAAIFQMSYFDMNSLGSIVTMRHDGRFRRKTKITACIISFYQECIIAENPFTDIRLPNALRVQMPYLPWFRWEHSYLRWPSDTLAKRIEEERLMIESLHQELEQH